jgi:two-component system sensor histidine kinase CreC
VKLWARVFLGYFLVVGLAGWFVLRVFVGEVKPGVREAVEDVMVDSANFVAELAADDLVAGRLPGGRFAAAVGAYGKRSVRAPIWGLEKVSLDFRVYVTDDRGIVRYDSAGEALGRDYSRWIDVQRTLRGQYGARTTRSDPSDDATSTLFVAAPIYSGQKIVGVATIAKPVAALQPIIERGQRAVLRHGAILLAATLLVGAGFTAWLTISINRLVRYARALAGGERAAPPARGRDEIGELSRALAALRQEVDGRAYVERYVQHLTHEMKSPLTAIRGASELLAEPLPEADRRRFAESARAQVERLRSLVERLLRLAQLEHLQKLEATEPVPLDALLADLERDFSAVAARCRVGLHCSAETGTRVHGDRFMLGQAVSALLENALEFSLPGGRVECVARRDATHVTIVVSDNGPGIPEYAQGRIFERFFSLPRPDGAPRSTGLGLSLAREIALLHHGALTVANRAEGGVAAALSLPA